MEYQKSVVELIKTRTSIRSYDEKSIEGSVIQKLNEYIKKINEEAKIDVRFVLTNNNRQDGNKAVKLGTYGVISGANSYILGILGNKGEDVLELGYLFEKIVLQASDLGLGTCWLGGTFKKSDFQQNIDLSKEEYIPIVSPVGFKKDKTRVIDSAMRAMAGSDKRKLWAEIFFEKNTSKPLSEEEAGFYAVPLEMVRLGPSASNKQPWRIIKDDNKFHFFLCRTKGYGLKSYDLQKNDIGIAKCHFELTTIELELNGKWEKLNNIDLPKDWEYMISWSVEV